MRADQLLLERGLATSRSQAQRLIASGVQWQPDAIAAAPWKRIGKNSDELPADARIELLDDAEARYVSRGGLKLEGALKDSGLDVRGKTCLDVGQSTGGFTDCLLQHGAAFVVGVDVGHGQLHPNIRGDARVLAIEGLNARAMTLQDIDERYRAVRAELVEDRASTSTGSVRTEGVSAPADGDGQPAITPFDAIVGDLSFISQTLVLPALVPLLADGGALLMLVKPQFELQPGQVGKHGIVKDPVRHAEVEQRIRECCAGLGLRVDGWYDSAVTGGDGNREFFVFARRAP